MSQLSTEERIAAAQEIVQTYLPQPHYYVKDILGANTWKMQDEIVKAVFKHKTVAVKTCNAVGKSFIAARVALSYLMLYPGSVVVTTAPTWRQVKDVLWREISVAVKLSKVKLTSKQVKQTGLDLSEDWFAVGLSTKYPENFFGYHADRILVIVDEAGGVPEPIFKGVKAITPNVNARVLYIGNPTNPEGTFYDAFNNPKLPIKRFTISAFESPNFTANGIRDVQDLLDMFTPPPGVDEVTHHAYVMDNLKYPYPALIDPATVYERYWEWGADSPAWESLVLGEFPSQAEMALIPIDLVRASMQMYGTEAEWLNPVTKKIEYNVPYHRVSGWDIPTGPPEYGFDIARFGMDLNVLTPRRGGWVEEQILWNKKGDQKLDVDQSADRVIQLINPLDSSLRLNLDDTGVGGGVTATLNRISREVMAGGSPAHRYMLAAYNMASKEFMNEVEREKYFDITSMMYWLLRNWFYDKKIALHFDQKLFNELVGRRVSFPNGKIKVETKDEYKKRTAGKSPDRSDSLALAFASGNRNVVIPAPTAPQDKPEGEMPLTSGLSGLGNSSFGSFGGM